LAPTSTLRLFSGGDFAPGASQLQSSPEVLNEVP
jgi:hypothetical protein